jgi:hypothetical protein
MAASGELIYLAAISLADVPFAFLHAIAAAVGGIVLLTTLQFCRHLLFLPGSIAASYNYRKSRLYPLWRRLTPKRIVAAELALAAAAAAILIGSAWALVADGSDVSGIGFALLGLAFPLGMLALTRRPGPRVTAHNRSGAPNILMIGSDTLRADRLGAAAYRRDLTPFIDSLAAGGCQFTACYVPCARTAPSLVSMLTGTWPHHHGIRDNFVGDEGTGLTPGESGTGAVATRVPHGGGKRLVREVTSPSFRWVSTFSIFRRTNGTSSICRDRDRGPSAVPVPVQHNRFGKHFPAGALLSGGRAADEPGRAGHAQPDQPIRRGGAVLPEHVRLDDASAVRFGIPALHAIQAPGLHGSRIW